jgi:hypothetical protein
MRAEIKDRAKFWAARDTIFNEIAAGQLAILKPEQRERLDQIQLQAQGPLAFSLPERVDGECRRNDQLAASATRWMIGRQLLYRQNGCPLSHLGPYVGSGLPTSSAPKSGARPMKPSFTVGISTPASTALLAGLSRKFRSTA